MFNSDLVKFLPGETVPVEVHADSNGDVATRGQGVEVSGENADYVEAQLVESEGAGIAMLADNPEGYDSSATYEADEAVGVADALLVKPVLMVGTADAYADPAVGDLVAWADGGVVAEQAGLTATGQDGAVTNALGVDGDGNLENASAGDIDVSLRAALPWGEVIGTFATQFGQAGKIAVAVQR